MAHEFHYKRMVQFVDTDMAGIIHFTNYFRYMEETEIAFYFSMGIPGQFHRGGDHSVRLPRVAASCDMIKPVTCGDWLDCHLLVRKIGSKSITYGHVFRHEGKVVARGQITVVCVEKDSDGGLRGVPVPDTIRGLIEEAPAEDP